MQDNSWKYDFKKHKDNIFNRFKQFIVEFAIICEIMCEEGPGSTFGSEEGLHVFWTLASIRPEVSEITGLNNYNLSGQATFDINHQRLKHWR